MRCITHFLITVKVIIPESAQIGEQDLAILVAASRTEPGHFAHAQITSTTRSPMLFLPNIEK